MVSKVATMNIFKSILIWITGICYVAIFFPVTFIIWLVTLPFDKNRSVIHWILVWQSVLLCRLMPVWKLRIEGREKLIRGNTYIIISNHQSLIDILIINCLRYRFRWISKAENTKLPVLGWYLRMADYITVDRKDDESKAEMLEKSLKCLKSKTSIMIFPEGTRSSGPEPGFFKRGAFQLALDANVPVLPVVIDGTGDILPKHGLIFKGSHKINMHVLDPVFPADFGTGNPEELALKFKAVIVNGLTELRSNTEMI